MAETRTADAPKSFWVQAIPHNSATEAGQVVGYLKHRRIKVGQRFQVTEAEYSDKWMQRVSGKQAKEAEEEVADTKAEYSDKWMQRVSGKQAKEAEEEVADTKADQRRRGKAEADAESVI